MRILGVLDHCEDIGEGNEENIGEVNESFITMKDNLGILKNEKSGRKITLNR